MFGGGSAFASALGGSKISSFASPGAPLAIKNDKPAKPFGAPESDVEDEDGNDSDSDGDEAGGNGGEGEKDDAASRGESTPAAGGEEEKKTKYKRGESDGYLLGHIWILSTTLNHVLHQLTNCLRSGCRRR